LNAQELRKKRAETVVATLPERELQEVSRRFRMTKVDDVLADTMAHVGGTELAQTPPSKAIGRESEFVKEQVVLALDREPALHPPGGDIRVSVTDDEIILAALWTDEAQRALAERIARSLAAGRTVRSEPAR
jgi:hypothetical protein